MTRSRRTLTLDDHLQPPVPLDDHLAGQHDGPRGHLQFQPRVSVLTLSSCGWTAESAKSPLLTC